MSKAFPVSIDRTPDGAYRLDWTESFASAPVRVRVHTDAARAAQAAVQAGQGLQVSGQQAIPLFQQQGLFNQRTQGSGIHHVSQP